MSSFNTQTVVENEPDRTHAELAPEAERAERQAGVVDRHGRRLHPAWAFSLVGLGFVSGIALMLFVVALAA